MNLAPFKFPPVLRIEPSASCNLACAHCPTGTVEMARGIMNPETFNRILEQIVPVKEHIRTAVLYHGGEPLLNKHFLRMVTELRNLGIPNIKTVSNGMLLDQKRADEILRSGIDIIEFSLDGRSPEENNFLRRKSSFEKVIGNIKAFIEAKRRANLDLPKIFISNAQLLPAANPELCAEPPAFPRYIHEALGELGSEVGFKCTWAMEWPHMGEDVANHFNLWSPPGETGFKKKCSLLDETTTVRWNGDVVACCYDLTSKFVLGNIRDQSLLEIWEGQGYGAVRASISKGKPIPLCQGCNSIRLPVYLMYKPEFEARFATTATAYVSQAYPS